MAIKWVKEINILNRGYSSLSSNIQDDSRIYLDTSMYSGTVSYYFEVVAMNEGSGNSYIYERDAGFGVEATVTIADTVISYARLRSSSYTPNNALKEKHILLAGASGGNLSCQAARLIIVQSHATAITSTETQIEIGSYEAGLFGGSSGTPNVCTYPKHFLYTAANWDGTKTWMAEVVWVEADSKYNFSCVLQKSANQSDWTAVHTIVDAAASETVTRTRVTIDAADMDDGYYYRIAHWNTGDKDTRGYTIFCAKIICAQLGADDSARMDYYDGHSNILTFYGGASYTAASQSFTGDGSSILGASFYGNKWNSPTGNVYARLYAHSGTFGTSSVPTGSPLVSGSIPAIQLSASEAYFYIPFSAPYTVTNGTKYCIVVEFTGGDASNNIRIQYVYNSGSAHEGNLARYSSIWSAYADDDLTFKVLNAFLTKTESTRLLVSAYSETSGLQNYDQYYDPDEWDGVNVSSYHEGVPIYSSAYYAKLQEDPNGTPSDITNSIFYFTGNAYKLVRTSAMTMPSSAKEIDCYLGVGTGAGITFDRIVHVIVVGAAEEEVANEFLMVI